MVPSKVSAITLGFSPATARNIANFLTNWIVKHQNMTEMEKGKFGGPDQIVEMDESCFFSRKNNKGRVTKQIWGFGFVVRGSNRLFVEIVEKRDANTLIPIINRWINKDCQFLISDEWRAYKGLKKLGYNHETIKHKDNFVDKENKIVHTQTIENRWGQIKGLMKKRGKMSRINFNIKIKELTWRITNRMNIQEKMLETIKQFNFE